MDPSGISNNFYPRSRAIQRLVRRLFGAQGEIISLDEPPGARRLLAEVVVAEHGWLSVDDLSRHPALRTCADSLPAAACLGASLGDKGIVCVLDSEPRAWSQTEMATFEVLVSAVEPIGAAQLASPSTAIVEMLPQLIAIARPDGYFNYFNRYWLGYAGRKAPELAGWGWTSLLHPDDRERGLSRWREALRSGEPCDLEMRLRRADSTFRWHSFSAAPLHSAGTIAKWCTTCIDIDDRRSYELELKQVGALLTAAIERERVTRATAEDALSSRDEFLAMLSHELRTPLSATLGWAHLLRTDGLTDTKIASAIESIERNSLRQAHLIDDLLDVSRMVTGHLQVQHFEIDLREIVENAVEAMRSTALSKAIDLELHAPSGAMCMQGDAARLEQVVSNLLSNAIKFTPRLGHVCVELDALEGDALLRVRDDGKGIPAAFLPHVFERFSQAERGTRQSQGGLGLGMAITERIVRLHGGSVSVESPGEHLGACFTVCLPIGADAPRSLPPLSSASAFDVQSTEVDRLDRVRILLVEDEEDIREMLTVALELRGAIVRSAGSVSETLRVLDEWQPTVLVSDVGLKGEDGCELLRQICLRGPPIPAVAISGYVAEGDIQRCLDAGFAVLVPKPFEPSALAAVVARIAGAAGLR
jgi:PAS domain S-box-containing protein